MGGPMLIRNYGLFWREDCVFWGAGGQGNDGQLLGVPARNRTANPINFREQRGVYALYAQYELVYVGQVGSGNHRLFSRLKQHLTDALAERWNRFSWFGINRVLNTDDLADDAEGAHTTVDGVLDHIEAILIHSAEPVQNRQGGRFGDDVVQYLQHRDDRLGPTADEMIRALWEEHVGPSN